ncbi:MAG: hypothetical protein RR512_09320 [Coprobacillus sp.]
MEAKLKQSYIEEIKYQTQMLNNLKRWLKNFIIFSSISLVLIVLGPSVSSMLKPIGFVCIFISIVGCLLVGLALKKGKDNVNKIIDYIEK